MKKQTESGHTIFRRAQQVESEALTRPTMSAASGLGKGVYEEEEEDREAAV